MKFKISKFKKMFNFSLLTINTKFLNMRFSNIKAKITI